MAKFEIRGCCYLEELEDQDWQTVDVKDLDAAQVEAWQLACENHDNWEGMHGLCSVDDFMEEDDTLSREDAEQMYRDDRESNINYEARPIEEEV